jgi:hypothetical protein
MERKNQRLFCLEKGRVTNQTRPNPPKNQWCSSSQPPEIPKQQQTPATAPKLLNQAQSFTSSFHQPMSTKQQTTRKHTSAGESQTIQAPPIAVLIISANL